MLLIPCGMITVVMSNLGIAAAHMQDEECDHLCGDGQSQDSFGLSLLQRHTTVIVPNKSDVQRYATRMDQSDGNREANEATSLQVHQASRSRTSKLSTNVTDYTRLYKNTYFKQNDWRWSGWISQQQKEFCRVQFQTDGNLVLYHSKNDVFQPLWAAFAGDYCMLATQTCSLECVIDWPKVVHWKIQWHSTRVGPCANPILVMQTDCNLVLYSGEGLPPVWATQTGGFVDRRR